MPEPTNDELGPEIQKINDQIEQLEERRSDLERKRQKTRAEKIDRLMLEYLESKSGIDWLIKSSGGCRFVFEHFAGKSDVKEFPFLRKSGFIKRTKNLPVHIVFSHEERDGEKGALVKAYVNKLENRRDPISEFKEVAVEAFEWLLQFGRPRLKVELQGTDKEYDLTDQANDRLLDLQRHLYIIKLVENLHGERLMPDHLRQHLPV